MNENKQLYKTSDGAVLGGICKGLSEVYNWDVSVVRLVALLLLFVAGAPFIIYIIMWLVLPNKEDVVTVNPQDDYTVENDDYYY